MPSGYQVKFDELKKLTTSLERDLPLEESLDIYERAMKLVKELKGELGDMEHRMNVVVLDTDGKEMELPSKDRR